MFASLQILEYHPVCQPRYKRLSKVWVRNYFRIDPFDVQTLENPEEYGMNPGGIILFAVFKRSIAGAVTLRCGAQGTYELRHLAIDKKLPSGKISCLLALASIEKAKRTGAKRITLYLQTCSGKEFMLYHYLGFRPISLSMQNTSMSHSRMELLL